MSWVAALLVHCQMSNVGQDVVRGVNRVGSPVIEGASWREPLVRLRAATSDREAQAGTVELINVVIDGGVAVSRDAEGAAASIIGGGELRGPLRIYVLWVLVEIGRCLGIWAKASDRGSQGSGVRGGIELETRVASVLETGLGAYVDLCSDIRPDVRSLAVLLTALCGSDTAIVSQLLVERERAETDELAKACALQALLIACARTPAALQEPALVAYLQDRTRSGTPTDRGRLRGVIDAHWGAMNAGRAGEVLADATVTLTDPVGPFWPIELL